MIEISMTILGAGLLTAFLWAFLTFLLIEEADLDQWRTILMACVFTATPFALGWLIYVLQYWAVIVFVK